MHYPIPTIPRNPGCRKPAFCPAAQQLSLPASGTASLPALFWAEVSFLYESLKKHIRKYWSQHTCKHQIPAIPQKQIPGTLQWGVWGLGSRTSLIQGPVIKVKRAHILLLYMQFTSRHIILHGTLTPSQMNIEQISPWRIPVKYTNTGIRYDHDTSLQKCRLGTTLIYIDWSPQHLNKATTWVSIKFKILHLSTELLHWFGDPAVWGSTSLTFSSSPGKVLSCRAQGDECWTDAYGALSKHWLHFI